MAATIQKKDNGTYPAYAWPGGYPIYYLCADGGTVCYRCVNKGGYHDTHCGKLRCPDYNPQYCIVAQEVYWEGPAISCDDCGESIESAYGDPDE